MTDLRDLLGDRYEALTTAISATVSDWLGHDTPYDPHGWRCEDKTRYPGSCGHDGDMTGEVMAVLGDILPDMLAQAWDQGHRASERDWEMAFDLTTPDEDRQPWTNPLPTGDQTMTTETITITNLAAVQPGDIVTADYIPIPTSHERGARIVGEASRDYAGGLIVGGYYLHSLLFISATREVPAWEPDEDEVRYLAQALDASIGVPESEWECWRAEATHLLTLMHDNGWRKDAPAESEPVDPVLDETDKRDRIDSDGDRWRWSRYAEVWRLDDRTAIRNLALLACYYGPLNFANEDDEETGNE